jgi:hypothetical protein
VRHRTVTVHCPVRATLAQALGFRAVERWGTLSSCCTGQSGATPDSLVTSDFVDLTSARHCSLLYTLRSRPLARRESLLRWLTRQSGGTPDSPVNYIGGCPRIYREWLVRRAPGWRTGQCPVHHFSAHSKSCSIFNCVPNLISFLVCVEPYAPVIDEF